MNSNLLKNKTEKEIIRHEEVRACGYFLEYVLVRTGDKGEDEQYFLTVGSRGAECDSATVSLGADEIRAVGIFNTVLDGRVFPSTLEDVLADIVFCEIMMKN